MELIAQFPVRKTNHSRIQEVDFKNLEFGKYVSDHMLLCEYVDGEWRIPHILPFSNLSISPTALGLHYGQTVFEGMKAFHMKDGCINIFRIAKHYDRFSKSLQRLCMAVPPKEIFIRGLLQLVQLDSAWVPAERGAALYIRPFVFASEEKFGVKISEAYRFMIFTGPVPSIYEKPIRVKVETHFVRAAKGGTGSAKCGGNYAASFLPTLIAREQGYDQVLWTDSKENNYIEESGMMNVMFFIGGKLVTPPLSDSILDGVTRDCLLTIAKDMGIETEERPISIDELKKAVAEKNITGAFGVGTAAVVAPISNIGIDDKDYYLPKYDESNIMFTIKKKLDNIRYGVEEDTYNWNTIIDSAG